MSPGLEIYAGYIIDTAAMRRYVTALVGSSDSEDDVGGFVDVWGTYYGWAIQTSDLRIKRIYCK